MPTLDHWDIDNPTILAEMIDELKAQLATTQAAAAHWQEDAERLAVELSLCLKALKKLDAFKPYPGCANPFAEVIVRAKAALAAHDAAAGNETKEAL